MCIWQLSFFKSHKYLMHLNIYIVQICIYMWTVCSVHNVKTVLFVLIIYFFKYTHIIIRSVALYPMLLSEQQSKYTAETWFTQEMESSERMVSPRKYPQYQLIKCTLMLIWKSPLHNLMHIIPWKFGILNPKNSQIIYPQSLHFS